MSIIGVALKFWLTFYIDQNIFSRMWLAMKSNIWSWYIFIANLVTKTVSLCNDHLWLQKKSMQFILSPYLMSDCPAEAQF